MRQVTVAQPGAHVCPADVATFKANVVGAVNRMVAAVGAVTAVHISCNDGDALDPVPTGDWTEASGGNGCLDGFGNPVGASGRGRVGARRVRLPAVHPVHQLHPRLDAA